ncbi:MAG: hypothetical protein ACFFDI_10010 [Promethearchaeota archaeon]
MNPINHKLQKKPLLQGLFQQNILWTLGCFLLGSFLNLSGITMSLLIILTAIITTWWQWRPYKKDPAVSLLLKSLTQHPAVFVKDYPHILVLGSNIPRVVAAYQSPVSPITLKRHLIHIKETYISIATYQHQSFLLLQKDLLPDSQLNSFFEHFQGIVELLEVVIHQGRFFPAKRFQLVHLFGLESAIKKQWKATPKKLPNQLFVH